MDQPSELELPDPRWNGLRQSPQEPDHPDASWNRFARDEAKPESRWPRRLAPVLAVVLMVEMAYAMPAYAAPRSAPAT
ncbi:hypothetical protein B0I32_129159 [Nonomuraea fuscirosea]|uniref:Uncharacterized protein n=1 Tax=Nonomuraea fuscirosea TaxID=1291556 RepID=A0A2T0M6F4_9ACTN|nr:hypothetical protein B0I32_129159 [Nonomuraea fuscirosea]